MHADFQVLTLSCNPHLRISSETSSVLYVTVRYIVVVGVSLRQINFIVESFNYKT